MKLLRESQDKKSFARDGPRTGAGSALRAGILRFAPEERFRSFRGKAFEHCDALTVKLQGLEKEGVNRLKEIAEFQGCTVLCAHLP